MAQVIKLSSALRLSARCSIVNFAVAMIGTSMAACQQFTEEDRLTKDFVNEIKSIIDGEGGALQKWLAILEMLKGNNLAYFINLSVNDLLVHNQNRGAMGVNAHEVHQTFAKVVAIGGDEEQLVKSTCFELPAHYPARGEQIEFNRSLVLQSGGLLAPVTGTERYLTCSSSHFTQGCRAAVAGCVTSEASIKDPPGHLNITGIKQNDKVLNQLLGPGWEWTVVCGQVAAAIPELPGLAKRL